MHRHTTRQSAPNQRTPNQPVGRAGSGQNASPATLEYPTGGKNFRRAVGHVGAHSVENTPKLGTFPTIHFTPQLGHTLQRKARDPQTQWNQRDTGTLFESAANFLAG